MFLNQLYESATILIWILAGVLLLTTIIQLIYYLGIFSKVAVSKKPEEDAKDIGISIIICAKNEHENLKKNLPAFLQQDYPNYEVVVVNDCSTDESENLLSELKVKYSNLRYTNIPLDNKFTHGKKLAITVGIKSAQNEHLLFSDADCYPNSDQWITKMSSNFSDEKQIVLGLGKYESRKGILNKIIRYETLFTAMQYLSFAIKGKPFMGVGRNMAYHRSLFFKHKGFASHLKVLSGDDDLFINEAATKLNCAVEISPESFTTSRPPLTWIEWFKQKKRHLTTGKYYKRETKFRLGMEYVSRLFFYLSFIWLLLFDYWWMIALGTYLALTLVRLVILKLTMRKLDEWDLLVSSLLLDPLMPIILFIIQVSNIIRPREAKWN